MSIEREGNVNAREYARYLESLRELYVSWLAEVNKTKFAHPALVASLHQAAVNLAAAEVFYRVFYPYKED